MFFVVSSIRREMRNHSAIVQSRLIGKLDKLSERQDRPLRNRPHINVVVMDGGKLPKFVLDIISLGAKRPSRDSFNKMHLLTDVDKIVCELRENESEGEKLCQKRYTYPTSSLNTC